MFLEALLWEMELYRQKLAPEDLILETLYLGGGTPTSLSNQQLTIILEASKKYFSWIPGIEVTIEVNPGTIGLEKLILLKDLGVNRLSIGAQSFNLTELKQMGRLHSVEEISNTVALARQAGFKNISLDLIYGLPNQTLKQWQYTLTKAFSLNTEHLSTYGLKIEENTPWGELEEKGEIQAADEDLARLMYDEIRLRAIQNSYEQYEISNFAKPGFESRHNSLYWLLKPYLGLGVSASSYLFGKRWINYSGLDEYYTGLAAGELPIEEKFETDLKIEMAEMLFLGLRLLKGISLVEFENRFGLKITDAFTEEIINLSQLRLITIQNNYLRLTEKGLPIANEVFQAFV